MNSKSEKRWICFLAVLPVLFSMFCIAPLLVSRPIAPLSAMLFLMPGGLALGILATWPRSLDKRRRLKRVRSVAVGSLVMGSLLLSLFVCACISAPMMALQQSATMYLSSLQQDSNPLQPIRDIYGGSFDGPMPPNQDTIWSEGPNGKNDGGMVSVVSAIRRFEGGFSVNYGESFLDSVESLVRRVALWEHVSVWGRFDGDILWKLDSTGKWIFVE